MKAYLINLDRATERRTYMSEELSRLWPELTVERTLAVDIKSPDWTPPPEYQPGRWRSDRWSLAPSDIEIFCSHMDAWARIAAGPGPGLVLEDDLLFSDQFRRSVEAIVSNPRAGVVRLDGLATPLLLGPPEPVGDSVAVSALHSLAPSAAAYLIWPDSASALLTEVRIERTVDDFLFDPYPSDRGARGHAEPLWQLEPAVCVQAQFGRFDRPDKETPEFLRVTKRVDVSARRNREFTGPRIYRLRKEWLRWRHRRRQAIRERQIAAHGGRVAPARAAEGLAWP